MGFFRFPWLRRMLRRHTTPIPYRKATRWRDRMSIAYLLVCWNLFGYLVYNTYNGKFDKEKLGLEKDEYDDLSASERFAIRAGIKNARIYRDGELFEFKRDDYQQFVDRFDKKDKKRDVDEDINDADNVYAFDNTTDTTQHTE